MLAEEGDGSFAMRAHSLDGELKNLGDVLVLVSFHKQEEDLALALREFVDDHEELAIDLLLEESFLAVVVHDVFLVIINRDIHSRISLLSEKRY